MVFAPATIVAPAGRLQLYPIAFVTVGTTKLTPICPAHTAIGPVIEPIAPAVSTIVTIKVLVVILFPQLFTPITVMLPLTEPNGKSTVIILVFPPATIAAPEGTVQL